MGITRRVAVRGRPQWPGSRASPCRRERCRVCRWGSRSLAGFTVSRRCSSWRSLLNKQPRRASRRRSCRPRGADKRNVAAGVFVARRRPPYDSICIHRMKRVFALRTRALLAATLLGIPFLHARGEPARGERGIGATVHALATEAGIEAFKKGGNAIDATVAAALTLGVVDGHNSGIGGGCFMLIRLADGTFVAIDGRETAPSAATRDMFVRNGKVVPELSLTGPLAAGVPGALAAYDYALRHCGKLSLKELLLAAAKIAEHGFPINRHYAERLAASAKELKMFEASRAAFLPEGVAKRAGEILRLPDLAKTYHAIADTGHDWIYRGPFATATAAWMKNNGGLLTAQDFGNYHAKLREPVLTTYRGCQLVGFPPPSSGGGHVGQILNIVENFDLKTMGPDSADFIHVVTEAMKLAFADRAYWLGDPDFVKVPRNLVAKDYAAKLARQ